MPILVIPWVVVQELDSLKVTSPGTIDLLPDDFHGNYNYVIIFRYLLNTKNSGVFNANNCRMLKTNVNKYDTVVIEIFVIQLPFSLNDSVSLHLNIHDSISLDLTINHEYNHEYLNVFMIQSVFI